MDHHYDTNYLGETIISTVGDRYFVDVNVRRASNTSSITIAGNAADIRLAVNGNVRGGQGYAGIEDLGTSSEIVIGRTGTIFAGYGVWVSGSAADIANHGYIQGYSKGIDLQGIETGRIFNDGTIIGGFSGISMSNDGHESMVIDNNGLIAGDIAMYVGAKQLEINIGAGGNIRGDIAAIDIVPDQAGTTVVTNFGTVQSAGRTAYSASTFGMDTFINAGRVIGDIYFSSGNDTFVDKGGRVEGWIYGGADSDTYVIRSARTKIFEAEFGGSNDMVKASVSYSLAGRGEIETVRLTGKADIDATGNDIANVLIGNKGDNRLDAGLQADALIGGKGADTFVYARTYGIDLIDDFEQGRDHIEIGGFDAVKRFADLDFNQEGRDVHIDFTESPGDYLIIDNARIRDFDKGDFVFV